MAKKVIHAHDQCAVGLNICLIGQEKGENWHRIPRLPEYQEYPRNAEYIYNRVAELVARGVAGVTHALLHIHGGHMYDFCSRTKIDYVLHLHGSEVRKFDEFGMPSDSADPRTVEAILKAKKVLYSTPDLARFAKNYRPDAKWLPIPISQSIEISDAVAPPCDIFFPHAWNHSKGLTKLDELLKIVKAQASRPLKLVGVAIGENTDFAKKLGFTLLPPTTRQGHIARMKSAKIVLGQGFGVIGTTDLEAIRYGANLRVFPFHDEVLIHYGFTSSSQPSPTIEDLATNLISDLKQTPVRHPFFNAVLEQHSQERIYKILKSTYDS